MEAAPLQSEVPVQENSDHIEACIPAAWEEVDQISISQDRRASLQSISGDISNHLVFAPGPEPALDVDVDLDPSLVSDPKDGRPSVQGQIDEELSQKPSLTNCASAGMLTEIHGSLHEDLIFASQSPEPAITVSERHTPSLYEEKPLVAGSSKRG